jgi:glycosyltransferase involved in cell wall biosynthesis
LRICIIGKYPPIQGGVSMRTYWTAHGLASLGHDVHVVTNAKEATLPFRMHMRAADWERCEASYATGSVTVHWTDPVDRSQFYIPMASPFVSKLATIAATAHSAHRFDVIFSHYLEPYGVAGYLASQMTGLPHVARMAGSDAGRLWRHPQFEAIYDHVLRSAEIVVAAHVVAERAMQRGVKPERIAAGGGYALPDDLFTPDGPQLDLPTLRAEIATDSELRAALWGDLAEGLPHFGIYGKLGESKGTFALLSALHELKRLGVNVGLVALAHGRAQIEERFRTRVQELELTDRVLQIPFLPHWRVPEFLRGCLAVCCLEQDFPIGFHNPITPLEVLLCGACFVGSTEVIRKLPCWERLPHSYGCVAIQDVNDVAELSKKLAAIVADPAPAALMGKRGRKFALDVQEDTGFPQRLESILLCATGRKAPAVFSAGLASVPRDKTDRFVLTQIAAETLANINHQPLMGAPAGISNSGIDMEAARILLAEISRAVSDGRISQASLVQAVETEIAIAVAEDEESGSHHEASCDPLFRLHSSHWAIGDFDSSTWVPVRDRQFRILHFNYDVSEFHNATTLADLPAAAVSRPSFVIVFPGEPDRNSLIVDTMTARFLELVDGRKSVAEILEQLHANDTCSPSDNWGPWVENLLLWGLIGLRHDNFNG